MTRLEDELRETFAARAAEVPAVSDLAGPAIARGRATRWRQRLAAGAAFAVVIALVVAGTWSVRAGLLDRRPDQRGSDVAAAPPSAAPAGARQLDLVVGGELRPADHGPIALPGKGDVYDAVRVSEGWLVVRGDKSTHELWLVRAEGTPTLLIDALPATFAFSDVAPVIAYQKGSSLTVAAFGNGTVSVKTTIQLPGHDGSQGRTGAQLVGWAGGSYVVIGNRLGIDYDGFDVWSPSNDAYTPTWNHDVVGVHAATPDDRSVVGTVRDARAGTFCAAVLDPAAGLRAGGKACGQPYLSAYRHGLSPDGNRFLAQTAGGVGIADAATGALIAKVSAAEGAWPAGPVWVDSKTFAVPEKDHILYVDAADPAHPRQVPGPSTSERWFVVPRVGG